jgi:hypothetical protein
MKNIQKFEIFSKYPHLKGYDSINILKQANEIVQYYKGKGFQSFNYIKSTLKNNNIDYSKWTDLEIIIYYLENYDD